MINGIPIDFYGGEGLFQDRQPNHPPTTLSLYIDTDGKHDIQFFGNISYLSNYHLV